MQLPSRAGHCNVHDPELLQASKAAGDAAKRPAIVVDVDVTPTMRPVAFTKQCGGCRIANEHIALLRQRTTVRSFAHGGWEHQGMAKTGHTE